MRRLPSDARSPWPSCPELLPDEPREVGSAELRPRGEHVVVVGGDAIEDRNAAVREQSDLPAEPSLDHVGQPEPAREEPARALDLEHEAVAEARSRPPARERVARAGKPV